MHIVLIIIGGLFAAFGGGCTIIMLGLGVTDPGGMLNDMELLLSILVPLGLLPLGIGIALIIWGIRMGRRKSAAPPNSTPPGPA